MALVRERLERELEKTLAEIEQLDKKLEDKAEYGLGKGGGTIYEWEFNLSLRRSLEDKAKSIEAALLRMEKGTYGICQECGRRISPERLAILPHTTLCIKCAQAKRR